MEASCPAGKIHILSVICTDAEIFEMHLSNGKVDPGRRIQGQLVLLIKFTD